MESFNFRRRLPENFESDTDFAQTSGADMQNPYSDESVDAPTASPSAQQNQYDTDEKSAEKTDFPIEEKSSGKMPLSRIILSCVLFVMTVASTFIFVSGSRLAIGSGTPSTKDFRLDLDRLSIDIQSDAISEVYELPKVYILPWNEEPAPKPSPEGFSDITSGSDAYRVYKDETIEVIYHSETRDGTIIHLADVKIAHPSQLRTAFAGGQYGTDIRYNPSTIAADANAVIATNADFYNYRQSGYIIRNGTTYRMKEYPEFSWDVLFIDDNGDFHIIQDRYVNQSKILKKYNIVNSLHFGPSLVIDGKIKILSKASGCGNQWNFEEVSPRTAIGQIGPLHYLMCVVEGRSDTSIGYTVDDMAELMLGEGCTQAYSLDGGKSATMIFGDKAMNAPLWGGERVVSDIVYFATAIPNE